MAGKCRENYGRIRRGKMETPPEQTFNENPDYLPLSIKVIVVWFYILALMSFFNTVSFDSSGFVFNAIDFVYGCLALIFAYELGSKRITSRLTAIVLAGWWFLPIIYKSWQALKSWQATARVPQLYIHPMGKEYTGVIAIAFFILKTAMQIYDCDFTLATNPKTVFKDQPHKCVSDTRRSRSLILSTLCV
jgi:hypothetical protein